MVNAYPFYIMHPEWLSVSLLFASNNTIFHIVYEFISIFDVECKKPIDCGGTTTHFITIDFSVFMHFIFKHYLKKHICSNISLKAVSTFKTGFSFIDYEAYHFRQFDSFFASLWNQNAKCWEKVCKVVNLNSTQIPNNRKKTTK